MSMLKDFDSYQAVAASQTALAIGAGSKGDLIGRVIITVATSVSGTCSLTDGADAAIPLTAANTPIGVYVVDLDIKCKASWKLTTGAGATALACGRF